MLEKIEISKFDMLKHYLKIAESITIDDIINTRKEAIRVRPIFSSFIKEYENKWNKKYKNFSLLEKDQINKEFYKVYQKIKKVKI